MSADWPDLTAAAFAGGLRARLQPRQAEKEAEMRRRRMLRWMPVLLCLTLASCSPIRHAMIRNAAGADLLLWPLGAMPITLKAGEPPLRSCSTRMSGTRR